MHSTNFESFDKNFLKNKVESIIESEFSSFYRNKYKGIDLPDIVNYSSFQKIPLLTKKEINEVEIEKKIFLPKEKITNYVVSSGTSGSGNYTVSPKSYKEEVSPNFPAGIKSSRVLLLLSPLSAPFFKYLNSAPKGVAVVPGDIHNLDISARASKDIKIDGIISTTTILLKFIDELGALDFDFNNIKWINLGSEYTSSEKASFLKNIFSQSEIMFRFGSSEVGGRGYQCKSLQKESPSIFHPFPNTLIEVLDENGQPTEMDSPNELIHTDLSETAFPVIRYRTGDIGSLSKKSCSCGDNFQISLMGRRELDVLKIGGVIIHSQAIASALESVNQYIEPAFQMHVSEKKSIKSLLPYLDLHLSLKNKYARSKNDPVFVDELKEKISSNLYLSSKSTLKNLVDKNIFLPLQVSFLDSEKLNTKTKVGKIISHLN